MATKKKTEPAYDLMEEAVNAGFLEPGTVAKLVGFDVLEVEAAEDITVDFDLDGELVTVTLTEAEVDYWSVVKQRLDVMEPLPDEIYIHDASGVRVARWGRVVAWVDGERTDVSLPYDTEAQAREAFRLSVEDHR